VKLTHKVGKLFSREGQARAWRRFQRKLHPISLPALLDEIDEQRLLEIQQRHAQSRVHPAKYADVERWLKTNIERVQDLKLNQMPPQKILDLGCGGGFFLFICKQCGHEGLGLDTGEAPVFSDLVDLLHVDRTLWKIKAFEPLPDLGRKFDWITAFSVGFNRNPDKSLWGIPEWEFFLNDLERHHLKPGGKIFLALNPQHDGWFYTDELRDFFVRRRGLVERERIYFLER
jgi:SAM-dependent methyltransferase